MKAVRFSQPGEPEVLQIQEAPDPTPQAGQVLVNVKATTINRLDLFQRDGSRPVPQLPFTPGLEAAGVVLHDAEGFKEGERVLTTRAQDGTSSGGYASILAVPAANLIRIPEGVSFEQAVAAGLAASTAYASLFDLGQLQAGERVLIWAGSSGVGTIAIQLAKQAGAWVATTSSSEERAAQLRQLGADLVIDYRKQDLPKLLQSHGGVNLVIELVSSTLQSSIEACAPDGRIILIGNLGGQQATVDTQAWRLKRLTIIGGGVRRTSLDNEQHILLLIAQKAITPVIATTMPVEQAAQAHRLLASGEPQGKIVLQHT
jgi:NADPH:quinone reductase-like Zn-dependent oxidoreductase